MSTRAYIGYKDNGIIKAVYNHSDGYPSYLGKLLTTYFTNIKDVKNLVSKGGISHLCTKQSLEEKKERYLVTQSYIDEYTDINNNIMARLYEDDLTYTFISNESYFNYFNDSDIEYVYLFEAGKWIVFNVRKKIIENI